MFLNPGFTHASPSWAEATSELGSSSTAAPCWSSALPVAGRRFLPVGPSSVRDGVHVRRPRDVVVAAVRHIPRGSSLECIASAPSSSTSR